MTEAPKILLAHHLKTLKLPTVLREHEKVARQCAAEGLDHVQFLSRLVELELIDRERRMVERRIKAAKFPAVKSLDSFDFAAIPKLNKMQVLELARCEWIERRENVIALGPSGTGKTHFVEALAHKAIDQDLKVAWFTLESLTAQITRANADGSIARTVARITRADLVVIDDIGMLPAGQAAAEAFYRVVEAAYERRSIAVTSNIHPSGFDALMPKTLATAAVDRLLHHAHVIITEGNSLRLSDAVAGRGVMPLT